MFNALSFQSDEEHLPYLTSDSQEDRSLYFRFIKDHIAALTDVEDLIRARERIYYVIHLAEVPTIPDDVNLDCPEVSEVEVAEPDLGPDLEVGPIEQRFESEGVFKDLSSRLLAVFDLAYIEILKQQVAQAISAEELSRIRKILDKASMGLEEDVKERVKTMIDGSGINEMLVESGNALGVPQIIQRGLVHLNSRFG